MWNAVGQIISTEARAMFNTGQSGLTFWAPNINIFRDPRWGRGQETVGEDPLVAAEFAAHFVLGMQGGPTKKTYGGDVDSPAASIDTTLVGKRREDTRQEGTRGRIHSRGEAAGRVARKKMRERGEGRRMESSENEGGLLKVSACCKHFTAYDLESWGGVDRHSFDAKVTKQDLEDTYQPPFRSCVQRGGASCIMCSYNAINGVPACADRRLLTNTARGAWSFDGYITSDCGAVADVIKAHHYTSTPEDTCNVTLSAGMDLNCGSFLREHASQAVARGKLAESTIDRAVRNLVKVQMRLGLFEGPGSGPWGRLGPADVATLAHSQLALEAARQGIVLLVNKNGTLPLGGEAASVALIGPHIDAGEAMLGNYFGPACHVTSPLAALRSSGLRVLPSPGCKDVSCADTSIFPDAIRTASAADVVLLFVGLDQTQEREGKDRVTLTLPGEQTELIKRVAAAAKRPVIVVILSGGPVDIKEAVGDANVGAILWAGYPGQAGGKAIADVLLGRYNPSGRLPVTWYPQAFVESVPMTDMRMRPDPERGYPGRSYRFYTPLRPDLAPIFEFGHGLSYSRFEYPDLTAPESWSGNGVSRGEPSDKRGSRREMEAQSSRSGLMPRGLDTWKGSLDYELNVASRDKRGADALSASLRERATKLLRHLASGFTKISSRVRAAQLYITQGADSQHDRELHQRASLKIKVSVTVQNTGSCTGQETVLLFVSPPEQAVREDGAALKSLIAFDKVELAPGERRNFAFTILVADLRIVDRNGERRLWLGKYVFKVGALQAGTYIGV
ncbi:Glycosyl hydrolase family protein [Klebsormidium nitens]|uniref:Glycosyl hydrolase family protein n=1 Tax=Klebsormidium nitens TaxID=105231 RepID=A0A1Y1IAK6_KLENI|nr:Glycosyl hydrolase family protein [Klebsormidium nitens]|eukprot:GAQ85726.1 Glycosyl hydrolase family protein [Klebsormidium nitens]